MSNPLIAVKYDIEECINSTLEAVEEILDECNIRPEGKDLIKDDIKKLISIESELQGKIEEAIQTSNDLKALINNYKTK